MITTIIQVLVIVLFGTPFVLAIIFISLVLLKWIKEEYR